MRKIIIRLIVLHGGLHVITATNTHKLPGQLISGAKVDKRMILLLLLSALLIVHQTATT